MLRIKSRYLQSNGSDGERLKKLITWPTGKWRPAALSMMQELGCFAVGNNMIRAAAFGR